MKYIEIEGKNEASAKMDFVNHMEINCEICNIRCTWEDVNIQGEWGKDGIYVCDDCNSELEMEEVDFE